MRKTAWCLCFTSIQSACVSVEPAKAYYVGVLNAESFMGSTHIMCSFCARSGGHVDFFTRKPYLIAYNLDVSFSCLVISFCFTLDARVRFLCGVASFRSISSRIGVIFMFVLRPSGQIYARCVNCCVPRKFRKK